MQRTKTGPSTHNTPSELTKPLQAFLMDIKAII